jgi:hypothetical protein
MVLEISIREGSIVDDMVGHAGERLCPFQFHLLDIVTPAQSKEA